MSPACRCYKSSMSNKDNMIDLTGDETANRHSMRPGGSDLTGEEEDGGSHDNMRQIDEVQRQAIMAFARSKLDSGGSQGKGAPKLYSGGSQGAHKEEAGSVHGNGDQIAEHAGSNKRARPQEQGSSEGTAPDLAGTSEQSTHAPKQCPAQPKNSMNDTLYMLRLEREERQRQRQRREAQNAGGQSEQSGQQQQQQPQGEGQVNGSVQHKRKREDQNPSASTSSVSHSCTTAAILSYNVWFDPDAMEERMEALGMEVERAGWPDFILLQEVTWSALNCFSKSSWIKRYSALSPPDPLAAYFTFTLARTDTVKVGTRERIPFSNSCQGRDLTIVRAFVKGLPLVLGNTHLESPVPGCKFHAEREQQLRDSLQLLQSRSQSFDILLGGDMNWIDPGHEPGQLMRANNFVDVWPTLRAGQAGLTYDARSNPMLTHSYPGRRLDRFFLRGGTRWEAGAISLVGTAPIPGKTVCREANRATKATKEVPLLVSDHFGLLLELKAQQPAGQKLSGSCPEAGQKLGGRREEAPGQSSPEVIVLDDD